MSKQSIAVWVRTSPVELLLPTVALLLSIPGWILSKFFVEEAFSKDAKAFGDRIIHDIKHQFVEKLSVAEWMSKDVRDVAIEKGMRTEEHSKHDQTAYEALTRSSPSYHTEDRLSNSKSRSIGRNGG